jgi:hypothetical protein
LPLDAHAGRGLDGDYIVAERGEPSGVATRARPDVECDEIRAVRDELQQRGVHSVGSRGLMPAFASYGPTVSLILLITLA